MAAAPLAIPTFGPDPIGAELARRNGRLAGELGVSSDELAMLATTTVNLTEAEQLGWISAEERRLYEGRASSEDLHALGYGEEETRSILAEQERDRACASSS